MSDTINSDLKRLQMRLGQASEAAEDQSFEGRCKSSFRAELALAEHHHENKQEAEEADSLISEF